MTEPPALPRLASPTSWPRPPRPSSPELVSLGDDGGWRPEPGEWSANECVGHMIEAERRGFAGRIRRILAADRPDIPADLEDWDPPAVAEARRDHLRPAAELAAEFEALRADGVEARPEPRRGRHVARRDPPGGRAAARRRAPRRMGPPRSEPHPPDAGASPRPASGLRWATPGGSASRTSRRASPRPVARSSGSFGSFVAR